MSIRALSIAVVCAMALAAPAKAALVSDTSGFSHPITASDFNPIPINTFTRGPINFTAPNGDTIQFSSTHFSPINYNNGYGFGDNGSWYSSLLMAGLDTSLGHIDFQFLNGPVSGAGGLLNYAPGFGPGQMAITALDAAENVLEDYPLTFATSGTNTGARFYILRNKDSPDISILRLRNAYVGIAEFTFNDPQPAPAPIPFASAAMAGVLSRRLRLRISNAQHRSSSPIPNQ